LTETLHSSNLQKTAIFVRVFQGPFETTLTEYKNGVLFDHISGSAGRLAKPHQYVVVVGQNHKHMDEIIACGAFSKVYVSAPLLLKQ
jgi:hypothetical protein